MASRDGGIDPAATQRRAALDQFEIVRREHGDLDDTQEITRPVHPLAIDLDPVASHPWDLDLDELLSAVIGLNRRADHRSLGTKSDQGVVGSTPKRAGAGHPRDGLDEIRLAVAVLPDNRGQAVAERHLDTAIRTPVGERQASDLHASVSSRVPASAGTRSWGHQTT